MSAVSIVPMLIDHCSPTLASLKCGSLFSITTGGHGVYDA